MLRCHMTSCTHNIEGGKKSNPTWVLSPEWPREARTKPEFYICSMAWWPKQNILDRAAERPVVVPWYFARQNSKHCIQRHHLWRIYGEKIHVAHPSKQARASITFWHSAGGLGCPQLGWISLTTLQEVDIYQQMTVVTLVFWKKLLPTSSDLSKIAKIQLSKSIFCVKTHLNLSENGFLITIC